MPWPGTPIYRQRVQADWTSGVCVNCLGSPSFTYSDTVSSDYANYIGPDGGTSSNFFFDAPRGSQVVLDLVDANGDVFTLALGTPEPSTWAMMLLGFAGLGFMAYRRGAITGAAATV